MQDNHRSLRCHGGQHNTSLLLNLVHVAVGCFVARKTCMYQYLQSQRPRSRIFLHFCTRTSRGPEQSKHRTRPEVFVRVCTARAVLTVGLLWTGRPVINSVLAAAQRHSTAVVQMFCLKGVVYLGGNEDVPVRVALKDAVLRFALSHPFAINRMFARNKIS